MEKVDATSKKKKIFPRPRCKIAVKNTYPVISTFISVGLSSSVRKNIADEKSRGKEVDKDDSSWATRKIIEALGMPALVKALE